MVDEYWQLSRRCLTRYLAVLVERRGVGEMAIFANHHLCDGRYSLPHPLISFIQTSPTYQFPDPSRLQRAAPSAPLNGQSHLPCHYRHQTNPANQFFPQLSPMSRSARDLAARPTALDDLCNSMNTCYPDLPELQSDEATCPPPPADLTLYSPLSPLSIHSHFILIYPTNNHTPPPAFITLVAHLSLSSTALIYFPPTISAEQLVRACASQNCNLDNISISTLSIIAATNPPSLLSCAPLPLCHPSSNPPLVYLSFNDMLTSFLHDDSTQKLSFPPSPLIPTSISPTSFLCCPPFLIVSSLTPPHPLLASSLKCSQALAINSSSPITNLCQFLSPTDLAVSFSNDPSHPCHVLLSLLTNLPINIHLLPVPTSINHLYASYTSFFLSNTHALVPTYNDANDAAAIALINQFRTAISVNARELATIGTSLATLAAPLR